MDQKTQIQMHTEAQVYRHRRSERPTHEHTKHKFGAPFFLALTLATRHSSTSEPDRINDYLSVAQSSYKTKHAILGVVASTRAKIHNMCMGVVLQQNLDCVCKVTWVSGCRNQVPMMYLEGIDRGTGCLDEAGNALISQWGEREKELE